VRSRTSAVGAARAWQPPQPNPASHWCLRRARPSLHPVQSIPQKSTNYSLAHFGFRVKRYLSSVMSSCLCKKAEGAVPPLFVDAVEDREDDAVDGGGIHLTGPGLTSSAHRSQNWAHAPGRFLLSPVPCSLGSWCERGDSNPHPLRDQILSLARLPIPPLSRGAIIRQDEPVAPRSSRQCRAEPGGTRESSRCVLVSQ
jgi:hypothetical protein